MPSLDDPLELTQEQILQTKNDFRCGGFKLILNSCSELCFDTVAKRQLCCRGHDFYIYGM